MILTWGQRGRARVGAVSTDETFSVQVVQKPLAHVETEVKQKSGAVIMVLNQSQMEYLTGFLILENKTLYMIDLILR